MLREVATRVAQRGKPQAGIKCGAQPWSAAMERSRPRLRLYPSRNRRENEEDFDS